MTATIIYYSPRESSKERKVGRHMHLHMQGLGFNHGTSIGGRTSSNQQAHTHDRLQHGFPGLSWILMYAPNQPTQIGRSFSIYSFTLPIYRLVREFFFLLNDSVPDHAPINTYKLISRISPTSCGDRACLYPSPQRPGIFPFIPPPSSHFVVIYFG